MGIFSFLSRQKAAREKVVESANTASSATASDSIEPELDTKLALSLIHI